MATLYPDQKERPKINYIATAAYNNDIYTYTTTRNPTTFQVTGALTTPFSAGQCPVGSVLRTNGRKLYPGGSYPGISTMMVGVINAARGVSGFIDPNSPNFAYYNVDKPVDVVDGVNPNGGATDLGMSVYTNGNITSALGTITAGGQVFSSAQTVLTAVTTNGVQTAQTINPALGQTFALQSSPPSGVASITLNCGTPTNGQSFRLIIAATTVQNLTITFGTNFKVAGGSTYVVTAAAGPLTRWFVVTFVCDGSFAYEVSRTATGAPLS